MKIGIIGSGIAGLISAAYLTKNGHEVHIFEQYHRVGGVLAPLEEDGYKWDLGQLLIEGMEPGEPTGDIFEELGASSKFQVMRDDRRYVFPEFSIDKPKDYQGFKWRIEELKKIFPEETSGLDNYYKYYVKLITLLSLNYKAEKSKGIHKLFLKLKLARYFLSIKSMTDWSAERIMNFFFQSKKLQSVFISILADFFTEPSKFLGLGVFALNPEPSFDKRMPAYINKYAKQYYFYSILGGISTMVDALEAIITEKGGNIHLNSLVTKIHIKDQKATSLIVNGEDKIKFDLIIANGGAKEVFEGLIGRQLLPDDFKTHLDTLPLMDGVFMVHLGLNYDPSSQTGGVCTYYYNTFDFEEGISKAKSGHYHKGEDGFVVHIPTAHSPEMAPNNHSSLTVYTICPDQLIEGSWSEKKEEYADYLIQLLDQKVPELSSHIVKRIIMTPEDFKKRINVNHFAFGGLAPEMGKVGMPFETCFSNLYYVGAQSQTGGGVNRIIPETASLIKGLCKKLEN